MANIAIVGAGLTGLSCAIRAAQHGHAVTLYESAPQAGGRTRSFFHTPTQTWVDNGPHLLIGVYRHTLALMREVHAESHIAWQNTLQLPLWEQARGHFTLATSPYLPFPMALIHAVLRMPGHGMASLPGLIRMAVSMRKKQHGSVAQWLERSRISPALQGDMLEVLCLGAMNEAMNTADAASFSRVLQEAFSTHTHARLGWFTQPLSQALIEPLIDAATKLGVKIHTSCAVQHIKSTPKHCMLHTRQARQAYDAVVIATPPHIRNRLFGIQQTIHTQSISNIHLWFQQDITLPHPFIGGLGTYGQWFFDVRQQHQAQGMSHLCAVVSADDSGLSKQEKISQVLRELEKLTGQHHLQPAAQRVVCVQQATHLVRPYPEVQLPEHIIDACEQPGPGDLPATIETAIMRGEQAAESV